MIKKKYIYVIYLFLFLVVCHGRPLKGSCNKHLNPLKTTDSVALSVADPFVYKFDSLYYLTGTTSLPEGMGFAYYTSTDLITWEYKGLFVS